LSPPISHLSTGASTGKIREVLATKVLLDQRKRDEKLVRKQVCRALTLKLKADKEELKREKEEQKQAKAQKRQRKTYCVTGDLGIYRPMLVYWARKQGFFRDLYPKKTTQFIVQGQDYNHNDPLANSSTMKLAVKYGIRVVPFSLCGPSLFSEQFGPD